jgi:hypothetical protein
LPTILFSWTLLITRVYVFAIEIMFEILIAEMSCEEFLVNAIIDIKCKLLADIWNKWNLIYSETPNLGPRNPGPKMFRTNKFPDFCKNLHTITCVLQISDQQIPGVLVKITVLTRSGVRSFTVVKWLHKKSCFMISRTGAMTPEISTTASPKYTDQINCTAIN